MIDYDKLRSAHELAHKYSILNHKPCYVTYKYLGSLSHFFSITIPDENDFETTCIDELIEKLKELTQPKPKYHIGQIVWAHGLEFDMDECVIGMSNTLAGYFVTFKDGGKSNFSEDRLYPTKQALIEAQIAYWTYLRNEEKSTKYEGMSTECSHDGFINCRQCNNSWTTGFRVIQKELIEECQHESDSISYPIFSEGGNILVKVYQFKCKKCGEFYR